MLTIKWHPSTAVLADLTVLVFLAPYSYPSIKMRSAATLSAPALAPPGRTGIRPKFNLVYNNYINGWVGMGSDIDMGAIQRPTKHGSDYPTDDYVATTVGNSGNLI